MALCSDLRSSCYSYIIISVLFFWDIQTLTVPEVGQEVLHNNGVGSSDPLCCTELYLLKISNFSNQYSQGPDQTLLWAGFN